jgi:hypothetical protein
MNAIIKQSHKQYKLLKKVKRISAFLIPIGCCVNVIGVVGFVLAVMREMSPNPMLISLVVGMSIMITGAIVQEVAFYQEARLRGRIRRYMQLIETIRQRQLECRRQMQIHEPRDWQPQCEEANLASSDSMYCLSV